MTRTLLAIALLLVALAPLNGAPSSGGAQEPSALAFHDLAAMTPWPLGRMQTRGAMGQTASFMVTELPPGLKTAPHHHHQEQMMLGLAGRMHYLMGDTPYPLPRLTAAIALANVHHGNINDTAEPAMCIEFQPVLRPDWYPPHPRRPREGLPEPIPIPAGRTVTDSLDPSSGGAKQEARGVRSKSLAGDTMRLTVMELSAGGGSLALPGPGVERFVFVIDGKITIGSGSTRREISKEMLVIAPPKAGTVRLSATKDASGLVAVYEPVAR